MEKHPTPKPSADDTFEDDLELREEKIAPTSLLEGVLPNQTPACND